MELMSVRRRVMSAMASGGNGYFTLLREITLSSDTHDIKIDFSDCQNYETVILIEDVNLSQSDWIYRAENAESPTGGTYTERSETSSGISVAYIEDVATHTNKALVIASAKGFATKSTQLNHVWIYPYYAATRMLAGSKFQIYVGGNT